MVFFCQVDFWLVFAKQSADLLDADSVCVCVFSLMGNWLIFLEQLFVFSALKFGTNLEER